MSCNQPCPVQAALLFCLEAERPSRQASRGRKVRGGFWTRICFCSLFCFVLFHLHFLCFWLLFTFTDVRCHFFLFLCFLEFLSFVLLHYFAVSGLNDICTSLADISARPCKCTWDTPGSISEVHSAKRKTPKKLRRYRLLLAPFYMTKGTKDTDLLANFQSRMCCQREPSMAQWQLQARIAWTVEVHRDEV